MRKAALILALLVVCGFTLPAIATSGDVTVGHDNLNDSDGWNYGARFWLSSTVPDNACTRIWVTEQSNVYGSVVPLATLRPNEQHFVIGQFQAAAYGKAWSVNVRAQWKAGTC